MPIHRHFLFIGICLLLRAALLAQPNNADSLRQRADELPAGAEQVNTLLHLSDALKQANWEAAMEAAVKAVQIAKQIRYANGIFNGQMAQDDLFLRIFSYAEAHRNIDRAILLARQQQDSLGLMHAFFRKANCYATEGKLAECIPFSEQALAIGEQLQWSPAALAGRYCQLGWRLGQTGDFEKALANCRKGLAGFQQLKHVEGECYAWTQLSLVYGAMGDNAKALEMQQQALAIAEKNDNQYWRVLSLHNICDLQAKLGNFDQALKNARQLSNLYEVLNDPNSYIELYRLNGRIFHVMKDFRQAQVNFQKALDLAIKTPPPSVLVGVWKDMPPTLIELNHIPKAKKGLRGLIRELEVNKDSVNLALCRMLLGEVKEAMGDMGAADGLFAEAAAFYKSRTMFKESGDLAARSARLQLRAGQINPAVAAARKSLTYFEKTHSKTDIADAHLLLYRVYKQKGDFTNALLHHEKYLLYLDSIKTQDLRRSLAEERIKQNVEDIEAQKASAERETQLLSTQNRLYQVLGALLLTILLAGTYLFWKLRKAKNLLNSQNVQLAQLNQAKDKFFGIIAHDLRGPLAAFQGASEQLDYLLEKGDMPKLKKFSALLSQSAINLGSLLDNLLSWALLNRGMIPYHPEPLHLTAVVEENFKIYEQSASAKGIRLLNNVPEHTRVQADYNSLLAILRNLIGNAIKFTPAGQHGHISVGCEERDGKVLISVNDTGTGIAAEKLNELFAIEKRPERGTAGEKGVGLGLILCRELVERHKGIFQVASTPGQGTTFEFTLPAI